MNRCFIKAVSLVIVLTTIHHTAGAQWTGLVKYELGVSGGAFIYQGDLVSSNLGSYKTVRPAFGLSGSRILGRAFSVRANLAIGGLRGDESKYGYPEYRKQRSFSFSSTLIELSAHMVWNPLGTNYEDKGLSPYLFGGGGITYLNTSRDFSRIDPALLTENSEILAGLAIDVATPAPKFIPVVPVGIGLRYGITPKIAVSAEAGYRFTFTDYVDGFSYAANPDKEDSYHGYSIGVIYRIGRKNTLNCPVVRR